MKINKPGRKIVWPVQLKHILWLPPLLALWLWMPTNPPLPHLLTSYQRSGTAEAPVYQRCTYTGPYGRTITPDGGQCPLIALFPKF